MSVGEINHNKNHRIVIEALAKLNRQDVRYVICGEGPLQEEYQTLVDSLGLHDRVVFAGFQADVNRFCQAADIYVMPSFREGLPVAIMEAMAAGLPCVASRIRGNVDLLPKSTLLFDPHNVDELCAALNMAMDKEIAEAEVSRNQRTLRQFEMREAADAMKNVYMEVMNENV